MQLSDTLAFIVFFSDIVVPVLQLLVLVGILYYVRSAQVLDDFDWHSIETPPKLKRSKRGK